MEVKHNLDISLDAILKILLVVVGVYFFWKLQSIVLTILLSAMMASALYPLVRYFHKSFSLVISSVFAILIIFIPFIVIIPLVIPSIIQDSPKLFKTINSIVEHSSWIPVSLKNTDLNLAIQNYIIHSTPKVTNALVTLLTVTFLTFYMLIDSENISKLYLKLLPSKHRKKFADLAQAIIKINGYYIRGNLFISIICFTIMTIGLLLLRVPYAVVLGLFAGVTDVIPLIGATAGAIPAIIVGFSVSPLIGILVIALYIAYQQVENNIIIPRVYNRFLNLSFTLTIISLLVGGALYGVTGAFIALPIAASVPTLIDSIYTRRK